MTKTAHYLVVATVCGVAENVDQIVNARVEVMGEALSFIVS